MNDDNTLPNTYFTGFHAKDLLNGYIANASGKDTAQRLEDKPQGIRRTVDQINQAHRDGTIGNIRAVYISDGIWYNPCLHCFSYVLTFDNVVYVHQLSRHMEDIHHVPQVAILGI